MSPNDPSKEALPPDSSLSKDVAKLASATTVAAIISMGATPIITRLFTPEAFGTAAIFVSIASIIGIVACLRYDMAILLPEEKPQASSILALCFMCSVGCALLTAFSIALYSIGHPSRSISGAFWLLPLAVFLNGLNAALLRWNARKRAFGRNSLARVSEVATVSGMQVGSGIAMFSSHAALIVGHLGGRVLSLVCLLQRNVDDIMKLKAIRKAEIIDQLLRYRKFPLLDSFSALANTGSTHLTPILLGLFFSPATAGFYALGYRLLQVPVFTLGNPIAQVFFQRFAEDNDTDKRSLLTRETFERLVIIALLPMALLGLLGRESYEIIFGIEWSEAGLYVELLSFWGFFWLITSPLTNVLTVLERQGLGFAINAALLISRVLCLLTGAYFDNARLAIILLSVSGAVIYLYLLYQIIGLTNLEKSTPLSIIYRHVLRVAPIVLALLLLKLSAISDLYIILIAAVMSAVYFAINYHRLKLL